MKKIGLFYLSKNVSNIESFLKIVQDAISSFEIDCQVIDGNNFETNNLQELELLITLGGDGTILHAANIIRQFCLPILAVSLGHLGFLAEITLDQCKESIAKILAQDFFYDTRKFLSSSNNSDETLFALNEFVLDGRRHRLVEMDVYVNDLFLTTYKADGLIVSTSTGSTAYNLSSGGPIIFPDVELLVLTPISPHSLTVRPLIVSGKDVLKINFREQDVVLLRDGQQQLLNSGEMRIQLSDETVKFIRFNRSGFMDGLVNKLNWNGKFHP